MTLREGNLDAPTRHPLDWRNPDFYNEDSLYNEMERIFNICHGCRRCVSLCGAFPTLFDLVDNSKTMEVDGVAKARRVGQQQPVAGQHHRHLDDVAGRARCGGDDGGVAPGQGVQQRALAGVRRAQQGDAVALADDCST